MTVMLAFTRGILVVIRIMPIHTAERHNSCWARRYIRRRPASRPSLWKCTSPEQVCRLWYTIYGKNPCDFTAHNAYIL